MRRNSASSPLPSSCPDGDAVCVFGRRIFDLDRGVASVASWTAADFLAAFLLASFLYLLADKLRELNAGYRIRMWLEYYWSNPVPDIRVDTNDIEAMRDDGADERKNGGKKNNKNRIPCYDPSTNEYLGSVPDMSPEDVGALCQKASRAQKSWSSTTTFAQRRLVLRTIQKYVLDHQDEICRYCSRDSGKTALDALLGEVLTTCEKIRTINSEGELWLRPSYRTTGPMLVHKSAYVEYVPLGVVATIAPWNYPFHNLLNHVISGIFAGNAVVTKVSEHTSWSALYFGRIVREALKAHGHDPDLCQVVTGYGPAGAALVADPCVDKVIFTGSTAIGSKVMQTAAKFVKPVVLELGGKDAMVIMDDVKMDDVLPWVMRGCFQNSGQNCVGVERVVVYESVYDEFVDSIRPKVEALRVGLDCGAVVTSEQMDIIQDLVDDAVKKGAKLLCGGRKFQSKTNGNFYTPTILADVTPEMNIFQREVFGPVMTIVKVPKDSDEACLDIVNDSAFGLGGSVYCGNAKRGLELGRKVRSGMMCINDFGSNYLVQSLPFGGVKESGFGRFAGIEGLRALCLERSILVDKFPGIRTTIPKPMDYPVDKNRGVPFAQSLMQLFYNESFVEKIKAIVGLIKYG